MSYANLGRTTYDIAFQVSPIILHGGIVSEGIGGLLPVIGLVGQLAGFAEGMITAGFSMEDFAFRFRPIPGATIISNAVANYPFANQQVAANAIIQQPLNISLHMIAPVKSVGGYITKLPIFESLRTSFANHNNSGGTYHIATPSHIYQDCIMVAMTDITSGETKQDQAEWQLDFVQPLITGDAAQAAYSGLMAKINGGQPITAPLWSGTGAAIGSSLQGAGSLISGAAGQLNNFLSVPSL